MNKEFKSESPLSKDKLHCYQGSPLGGAGGVGCQGDRL